jgi:regulator of sigma D
MLCLRHSGFCQRKVDYISVTFLEVVMSAISNGSARAIARTQADVHPLMIIALCCALVFGAAFCAASFGLDLSAGLF